MIEGGVAGGSAQQQAAQRRATADRLLIEASWLEGLAADEATTAARLAELPPAYAILHDLRLPGSKGNIDHLIVGPGGAFVVLTRRCSEAIEFRDGQLWSGEQSLLDVLGAARVESQLLTQTLATPVVPIVALLDAVLPAATPQSLDGVLVCSGEHVVRTVTRGSHTQLPPNQVVDAAERALPLLHNPGSVPRVVSALGVHADPAPDISVNPVVPPPRPASEHSVRRRRAAEQAVGRSGRRADAGGGRADQEPRPERTPPREKSGAARSARFIAVVLVSLCVAAVGLGTLIRMLWPDGSDRPAAAGTATTADPAADVTTGDGTIDVGSLATASGAPPLADAAPLPVAAFDPACPVAGEGWQLQPRWPGDVAGLVRYDVDIERLDSAWDPLPPIVVAGAPWAGLSSQPANATYTIRLTAVMTDGSRRVGEPTVVVAPADEC